MWWFDGYVYNPELAAIPTRPPSSPIDLTSVGTTSFLNKAVSHYLTRSIGLLPEDWGVNPNTMGESGLTPLATVAKEAVLGFLRVLLGGGARADWPEGSNNPLASALNLEGEEPEEMVRLLKEYEVRPSTTRERGDQNNGPI